VLCGLWLASAGCGESGLDPAAATRLSRSHIEHFEGFDLWARRAVEGDPTFRDRRVLEERLFAPIRREEEVFAVWVSRAGGSVRPLSFGHEPEPPAGVTWIRIRDARLGPLEVTTVKVPDPRRRLGEHPTGETCVLLRRTAQGSDGREIAVTVAYRDQAAESD
jgi:hypothetical protein